MVRFAAKAAPIVTDNAHCVRKSGLSLWCSLLIRAMVPKERSEFPVSGEYGYAIVLVYASPGTSLDTPLTSS